MGASGMCEYVQFEFENTAPLKDHRVPQRGYPNMNQRSRRTHTYFVC